MNSSPPRTSSRTDTPRTKHRISPRRKAEARAAAGFLLPWAIGLVVFVAGPVIVSAYLSFTDYDLVEDANIVGVSNYKRALTADPNFWQSLKVTGVYVGVSVPLRLVVAMLLAVLLNRGVRGLSIYRALLYLPSLLGGSVAIALLWRALFGADGAFNAVLSTFGLPTANWIGSPDTALGTMVLLAVWQFGSPLIIFLAALRNVPQELEEAATVDGAGAVRRFFSITIPMITPMILFNVIMQTITAFQAFTPSYIISDGTGGPDKSTLFYTLYLYQEAFTHFRMGYASALAWILVAIIAIVTAAIFASSRRWTFYNDGGK
jgi:multiple sugar transport system permease protein